MDFMNASQRKYTALTVLFSLVTLVSGVCYGTVASASMMDSGAVLAMDSAHCGDQAVSFQKSSPIDNEMMPCCIDRHDNVPTTLPTSLNSGMHFSGVTMALANMPAVFRVEQKTYASSLSPPPRPDKLFSLLKKE